MTRLTSKKHSLHADRARSMDKAAEKVGLPVSGDCNDPEAPALGFFHLEATIDEKGQRISALKAFLSKELVQKRRDRLSICKLPVVEMPAT